ncbi:MAG: class I SAM-dependent methyltransferase [Acidobacteria bacterium]|nr:class I SAM-dependent methyltransferase [Acidobacteriota bacterium]MCI0723196.1 class I SAM-dependent methyltransferase [Acidobacteriota bacterium]
MKARIHQPSRPCPLFPALLSKAESDTRRFYDRWIGGARLVSMVGRFIFRLSGVVYSGSFIRAAGLASGVSVLEIGCGMGSVLTATRRRLRSTATYLGVDLSIQMVRQGHSRALEPGRQKPVSLVVASGLSLPIGNSGFDVVLLSHVIKYLTDEQLNKVLWEAKRVLKPAGRVVLWEFSPVLTARITGLIVKCCHAEKLRGTLELRRALKTAGFRNLRPFRVVTPWLPWSNVAFTGSLD